MYHRVQHHAPQKNPDVFELTRAKMQQDTITSATDYDDYNNLPSGYFRDLVDY